jgi:hypothetical protein
MRLPTRPPPTTFCPRTKPRTARLSNLDPPHHLNPAAAPRAATAPEGRGVQGGAGGQKLEMLDDFKAAEHSFADCLVRTPQRREEERGRGGLTLSEGRRSRPQDFCSLCSLALPLTRYLCRCRPIPPEPFSPSLRFPYPLPPAQHRATILSCPKLGSCKDPVCSNFYIDPDVERFCGICQAPLASPHSTAHIDPTHTASVGGDPAVPCPLTPGGPSTARRRGAELCAMGTRLVTRGMEGQGTRGREGQGTRGNEGKGKRGNEG